MFEYVNRQKGVELSHAIYHHAKENKSNIGLYFATFTLGTIREQSGNMGLAEKSFHEALKLKEKYLTDESAAPCYLGLCETALQRRPRRPRSASRVNSASPVKSRGVCYRTSSPVAEMWISMR